MKTNESILKAYSKKYGNIRTFIYEVEDEDGQGMSTEYSLRDAVEYLRDNGNSGWRIVQFDYPISPENDGIALIDSVDYYVCTVWEYDDDWSNQP